MRIEYASYTNIGDCTVNEDSVLVSEQGLVKCFLIADGLGGHGGGDIASSNVASVVESIIKDAVLLDKTLVERCFVEAQKSLLQMQKNQNCENALKTTMVLLVTDGAKFIWGHIGDSRLYYFRNGKIKSVTSDHSVPQMMVNVGKIKAEELRHHPERNVLLKVLGVPWDGSAYEIDNDGKKIEKNDMFVLCSDGLWEWIADADIERLVNKKSSPQDIVSEMGTFALVNGSKKEMARDNLSIIFVKVTE